MFAHYERAKDASGEYIKFGNQDIDISKSHLNYNLAPNRDLSQGKLLKKRCSEVKCMNRKDVNIMCSWVLTLPKEVPKKYEHRFFQVAYKFLEDRYGKENVISSFVHLDEAQPHMHFAFIPVVKDKKKGHLKVSAKECINLTELNTFHTHLQAHMEDFFAKGVKIINGATKKGNMSVNELKNATLQKQITEKEEELSKVDQELENQLRKISDATNTHKKIANIEHHHVKEIKTFGKVKGVSMSVETFEAYDVAKKRMEELEMMQRFHDRDLRKLMEERDYYKDKVYEISKELIEMKMEHQDLVYDIELSNERITDIREALSRNPILKEEFQQEYKKVLEEKDISEKADRKQGHAR